MRQEGTEQKKINTFAHPNVKQGTFYFPSQSEEHEATWLQWPNKREDTLEDLEYSWVAMARALCEGEIVRIVANSEGEKQKIKNKLSNLKNIEIYVFPTNEYWMRDNGPIFVYNYENELCIGWFKFTGWGDKMPYKFDCQVPRLIAQEVLKVPLIDLTETMNVEGGSVQIDGNGTMFVCESSVLNSNRNKGMRKHQAEEIFKRIYGVRKIVWLRGTKGYEITDNHCDALLKFPSPKIMLTMSKEDLIDTQGMYPEDADLIHSATNADGEPYRRIILPLTVYKYDVEQFQTKQKGSYVNCYCGNKVVLVPQYNDPNDEVAFDLIQLAYPGRKIVGIDVEAIFYKGGMIHCVTQQQPKNLKNQKNKH